MYLLAQDVHRNYVHTSYTALSSSILWNVPQVTCIFWYTHKPLGKSVYQENMSQEWDIPRLDLEKGLRNYFIPCYRK